MTFDLGDLADPNKFTDPLELEGETLEQLRTDLETMVRIRKAEEKIADMLIAKEIKCPCHLAIGQEAIAVGMARHLRKEDRALGTHRSHGQYLAMGNTVESLFCEVLGKVTGCSKGMGGSMHLYGQKDSAFAGSVPIVAGTVPVAVGAALAAKLDQATGKTKDRNLGVAFFGDGAAEEGVVHEAFNFASVFKLPMMFVCENNFFSSHLHISVRQPKDMVARFAVAHNLEHRVVDGNDIVAVSKAAKELADYCRSGEGAAFLEVITYRWRGHVGPSEDIDVGLKRGEELHQWKLRDPIGRLHKAMLTTFSEWSEDELNKINRKVDSEIATAWENAVEAPYPDDSQLLSAVYHCGEVPNEA